MKFFLSKKASEYKFPIIFRYFFLTFPTFFYHRFFFNFPKKKIGDEFLSKSHQDKPKTLSYI